MSLTLAQIIDAATGNTEFAPINTTNEAYFSSLTSERLTDVLAMLASEILGRAATTHTHTGYAAESHTHTGYAAASHTHADYMTEDDAADAFAGINHTHTPASIGAAAASHTHDYAASDHTHTPASIGAAAASHTHSGYAASGHTHTASEVGAAAAAHTHSEYAASSHSHTAADVGALPASGGTVSGNLVVTGTGTIKGKAYTQQMLPMDAGSYSIGSSDNRYYSTYLRVNPNVSSDLRCKRDVETMDINALAAFVNKLSVVNYNYKDDEDDEAKRIGLIAQDVVAADPTIAKGCIEQDEKGFYSLRAADLVFPLIAAVQALSKRVEELESK